MVCHSSASVNLYLSGASWCARQIFIYFATPLTVILEVTHSTSPLIVVASS